jgi:transcriptional regulator with XRE-family HTH domain
MSEQSLLASSTPSTRLIAGLARRLEAIRLARNISQKDLADEAGVSRSTMTRLADGRPVSLDSFVRIMVALGLETHLQSMLPDPLVQPVQKVRMAGQVRKRARRPIRPSANSPTAWLWDDNEDDD